MNLPASLLAVLCEIDEAAVLSWVLQGMKRRLQTGRKGRQ
jgi:hypothetical protein